VLIRVAGIKTVCLLIVHLSAGVEPLSYSACIALWTTHFLLQFFSLTNFLATRKEICVTLNT